MNLLGIQDALKNASDQQLAQLMQAPDSTAPSYLVLSELRRRKEMRAQQAQPPQGTVAQDLTSEENMQAPMGIRSLSTPEPGDEEYPTEEGDGIEAMREGGMVRMAGGGRPPPALPGSFYGTSMADLEEQARNQDYERAMSGIETNYNNVGAQNLRSSTATQLALADIRSRINSGTPAEQAFAEAIPGYRMADASGIRQLLDLPSTPATPPSRPTAPAATAVAPADVNRPTAPAANEPPPMAAQPVAARPGSAGGIGAMGRASAAVSPSPDGAPSIAQNMERNLALFPGIPDELMERIRASRTNEGDRRKEAQNMALIEAGLRMAASNNPRLGAAFAEGAAPAVQSYAQQLGQIRQDQNADLTRELSVAQADLQRRYMAGQISAAELQRQVQMLELAARERQSLRSEAGANARAGQALSREELRAAEATRRDQSRADDAARVASIRAVEQSVERTMADMGRVASITTSLKRSLGRDPTRDEVIEEATREAIDRSTRVGTAFARLGTGNTPRTNSEVVRP